MLAAAFSATPALAAPGDLDPTFSTDGKQTIPGGPGSAAIATQPDGKVLITGWGPSDAFLLYRVRTGGALDWSFGYGGQVETEFEGGGAALALALQPDGRIVVVGGTVTPQTFALARYLPDGTLDDSFSDDGRVTTDLSGGATDVVVQPDGRIVAVGCTSWSQGAAVVQAARFDADGSLDDSFSGDGVQVLDIGCGDFSVSNLALAPDGGIVLASDSSPDIAVARLRPNGTLDPSFSGDGMVTVDPPGAANTARDLVVQPDGKILTAGHARVRVPGRCCRRPAFELLRFQADGELDPAFSGGVVTTGFARDAMAQGLALQPDGKVIAAGETAGEFAAARYNSDGALDDSFSYDGKLRTHFWITTEYGSYLTTAADDVALDPDGRIVVGGHVKFESGWALARYEASPGPHDTDADGVRDAFDGCPARYATADVGCDHFRRSLSMRYADKYDEFTGRLSSGGGYLWEYKCESHQRVAVFKRRPGPDRRIGRDYTDYDGKWEVSLFRPRGRYYARVKRWIDPRWGVCGAARSEVRALR